MIGKLGLDSLVVKIAVIGIVVVLVIIVGHFIIARLNLFHDSKFDEKIQEKLREGEEKAGQVQQLTTQIEEANKRAEIAEKREQDMMQESLLYKAIAEASSKRASDVADKIADEDKRYNEELNKTPNDALNPCDRWLVNCERAVKLIKGFKGPCNCDQVKATAR